MSEPTGVVFPAQCYESAVERPYTGDTFTQVAEQVLFHPAMSEPTGSDFLAQRYESAVESPYMGDTF
jgi:hypothetical protein